MELWRGVASDGPGSAANPCSRWNLLLAGLFVVPFVLYGWHLRDGLLSDDFGYATLAVHSLRTLLLHLTMVSNPRVLRPLPGFPWLLLRLTGGAALLHLISVVLHGANGVLLAWSARRSGASPSLAAVLALLFCVFPLFNEPVVWLSCGFDLWATFFALLTVALLTADPGAPAMALAAAAFVCALLSKESVFLLPVALLAVMPAARRRRLVPVAVVAAVYLAFRLLLFHGLGGYQAEGSRVLPPFSAIGFAGEALIKLPQSVLVPLKVRGLTAAAAALLSVASIVAAFRTEGTRRMLRPALLAAGALLVSILPAAQIFHPKWDQEGSRCLYLPVAIALLVFGRHLRQAGEATLLLGVTLALGWGAACIANGRDWTKAHQEVETVVAAMRENQDRFPPGATVFVDAHDTLDGAYVFRNGLPQAAALNGLRTDLTWIRGTSARSGGDAASLGLTVFDLGVGPGGGAALR